METHRLILPRPDDVEELLEALLGRKVEAKRLKPGEQARAGGLCGIFKDNEERLRAIIYCELETVNACGGALSLIPPAGIQDANEEGEIPLAVRDNFREILNIMAGLFNDKRQKAEHVRFRELFMSGEEPQDVSELMTKPSDRLDVSLVVAGYGGKGFGVVVA